MLNKKITALVLILTFVFSLSVVYSAHAGTTDTWFKPNVDIPGMDRWLHSATIDSGPMAGQEGYKITPDSIGTYISGVYDFAAGFVGIVAMFMLVIAGWQWLFASGNADRINNAKQTINGVLIGLALLFGGHILLEQISVTLTEFEGISVGNIAREDVNGVIASNCAEAAVDYACGSAGAFQFQSPDDPETITNCPGGLDQCANGERCVSRAASGNGYDSCTMEYMIAAGSNLTGLVDCLCLPTGTIDAGNAIRYGGIHGGR